jgi:hypothetical protein
MVFVLVWVMVMYMRTLSKYKKLKERKSLFIQGERREVDQMLPELESGREIEASLET